jgi:hypothetical protein
MLKDGKNVCSGGGCFTVKADAVESNPAAKIVQPSQCAH